MFIYDFGVEDQFLSVIIQHSYRVFNFTAVEPLDVDNFPDLCDESARTFEYRFFASDVSEISFFAYVRGMKEKNLRLQTAIQYGGCCSVELDLEIVAGKAL